MKNQHFSIEGLRNITETIGDNIRTCRKAQGLTQKELAEKMTLSHDKKITKSFLSICENGKNYSSVHLLLCESALRSTLGLNNFIIPVPAKKIFRSFHLIPKTL